MTAPPRLSVIVPVYRVQAYLAQCLDSLLEDAGASVEVVAIDDASPDRCGEVLDDYARRDPRVRVVHMQSKNGLGGARNEGLDHATGDYVWFVDSDDWVRPGSVHAIIDRLGLHEPDVLLIDHIEVYSDGQTVASSPPGVLRTVQTPLHLKDRPDLLRLAQSACTKVIKRAFLEETQLRFASGWYEDVSFSHPLLMQAGRLDVLDRICYVYRHRYDGAITKTVSPRHFEVFDQYERLFAMVDDAAGALDTFRPELFRFMINHYLVILGNRRRLPVGMQREFFHRVADEYRRWRPGLGYPAPQGSAGVKHRLVRHDAYWAYATLRLLQRMTAPLRRTRVVAPSALAVDPAAAAEPVTLPRQRTSTELETAPEPGTSIEVETSGEAALATD